MIRYFINEHSNLSLHSRERHNSIDITIFICVFINVRINDSHINFVKRDNSLKVLLITRKSLDPRVHIGYYSKECGPSSPHRLFK